MPEMNGLRILVDNLGVHGTIHAMTPPPERKDFATDSDYSIAYDKWWTMMHCWRVKNHA